MYYKNSGDRYEGDFKNNKRDGKGVCDIKNGQAEGGGITYFHIGDRAMGNYHNSQRIGNHIYLSRNGEFKKYEFK